MKSRMRFRNRETNVQSVNSLLVSLLLISQAATPGGAAGKTSVTGNGSLAFASLIAEHSPLLSAAEKKIMAGLLDDRLNYKFAANQKISVAVDSILCRESTVAIASRSCQLTFGETVIALAGRKAHEVFATLVEIGAPSEGAAGSISMSASHVVCTVDPNQVQQKDGGGASCQLDFGGA